MRDPKYWLLLAFLPFLAGCSMLGPEVSEGVRSFVGAAIDAAVPVITEKAVQASQTGEWSFGAEEITKLTGTALAAAVGVNHMRNSARKKRGEPV